MAEEIDCSFYKATATDKQELLEQWTSGRGGWIVATDALGMGINIPSIIYIIYLSRLYELTSFIQQAGRGGRAGEISDSIIILSFSESSSNGSDSGSTQFITPRQELINAYSVEAQDKAVLIEYLKSCSC